MSWYTLRSIRHDAPSRLFVSPGKDDFVLVSYTASGTLKKSGVRYNKYVC